MSQVDILRMHGSLEHRFLKQTFAIAPNAECLSANMDSTPALRIPGGDGPEQCKVLDVLTNHLYSSLPYDNYIYHTFLLY